MSAWDPYIQSIEGKYPNMLAAVGIWGSNGARWASKGVELSVTECEALYRGCGGDASLCGAGFSLNGQRFACTKVDGEDGCMIGRGKNDDGHSWPKATFCCFKINGAVLFAIGGEGSQGGSVNMAVGSIAEYLRDNGYGL